MMHQKRSVYVARSFIEEAIIVIHKEFVARIESSETAAIKKVFRKKDQFLKTFATPLCKIEQAHFYLEN